MDELLKIKELYVQYNTDDAVVHAVNGVNLIIHKGEALGLVGETGAGKTTTALSVLGILPEQVGEITSGDIIYNGKNVREMNKKELQEMRGKQISMIFQDPMTSLNPIISVGDQIGEMLTLHFKNLSNQEKEKRVDEIMKLVGIPPERKVEYPFQFSGGMKQRVGIAIALVCQPQLLIADEPTTALDVTIQAQILQLMRELKKDFNTAMVMITHDLGIVAETCDSVAVMYAGEIVENGTVEEVFQRKENHPYTTGLFNCIPKLNSSEKRLTPIEGYVVDPTDLPKGCKFHDRCPLTEERCGRELPPAFKKGTHAIKCFRYEAWGKEEEA
ncbi:MAG TPA: ABC transporter ATP-binding protein [Candidatus Choladousia intestinavium]|uniref:ABC transporter ATP-binding protein n=1 Tax=Candidatus Choladousia intestinavium TaxID=2840727 RepID=A0A9D1AAT0_9FIRM|nr:ABC transporter ATP-binding protein [Candidatus Choladousia intestinavium]